MRLHPRARLKFDRIRSTWMLMYPEGGLVLNRTAFEVAELCQHPITRTELLAKLASLYPDVPCDVLENDTQELLTRLEAQGLLEPDPLTRRKRA